MFLGNDTMIFSHLSSQPKETGNEPELSQRDSSKTMDLKHWGMEGLFQTMAENTWGTGYIPFWLLIWMYST